MTAFKRNKNLKEIIGDTRIDYGKVKKFSISSQTMKMHSMLIGGEKSMSQPGDNMQIM